MCNIYTNVLLLKNQTKYFKNHIFPKLNVIWLVIIKFRVFPTTVYWLNLNTSIYAHMSHRHWASAGGCLSPAYTFTAAESFGISASQGLAFFLPLNFFFACQSDEVGKMTLEQKTKLKVKTIKKDWLTPHYHLSVNNTELLGFCTVFLWTFSLTSVKPQDNNPSWSQSGEQLCGPLIRESVTICLLPFPQIASNRVKLCNNSCKEPKDILQCGKNSYEVHTVAI